MLLTGGSSRAILASARLSCYCHLLNLASTALDLKDIHMTYPDVNINKIKGPLFLDVSIEIVKFK